MFTIRDLWIHLKMLLWLQSYSYIELIVSIIKNKQAFIAIHTIIIILEHLLHKRTRLSKLETCERFVRHIYIYIYILKDHHSTSWRMRQFFLRGFNIHHRWSARMNWNCNFHTYSKLSQIDTVQSWEELKAIWDKYLRLISETSHYLFEVWGLNTISRNANFENVTL